MPYVPTPDEARRLRRAIDRASFREGERVWWMLGFLAWLVLDAFVMLVAPMRVNAVLTTAVGALGSLGVGLILYWRLRGGHLVDAGQDPDLHSFGLTHRDQRAFTALMLRSVLTGTNPLAPRVEHDPLATFQAKVARAQARDGSSA